jgi:hypothetical protein
VLPPKPDAPPPAPGAVRLVRINKVFTVDYQYQPRGSLFFWTGNVTLELDGDWREFIFR